MNPKTSAILHTVRQYYQNTPVDPRLVQFTDDTRDEASISLLAQLSPVWKCSLSQTGFQQTAAMDLGLTRAQFEAVKDIWLRQMVADPHPGDTARMSAAASIRLLIALDMCQIHPTIVDHFVAHVQHTLTVEDCALIAGDRSIRAMPHFVLELILPTLLERPRSVPIINLFLRQTVRRLKGHIDPRGLVWINRQKSVSAIQSWHISHATDALLPVLREGKEPRRSRSEPFRRGVVEALALDDVHVVCQFIEHRNVTDRDQYIMCVNTETGEVVGRPRRILWTYRPMVMNGRHFVFSMEAVADVHARSMEFFLQEEEREPCQILRMNGLAKVQALCRGGSDLLFIENYVYHHTIAILKCTGPDDTYVPQYTISLRTHLHGFRMLGGLVLSPTRVVLHFETKENERAIQRMKLQLFERDAPVCPPCDVGAAVERDACANRLCHRYGKLYFFRDRNDADFKHGIWTFDAAADDLSTPLSILSLGEQAALVTYGARMLVLPTVADYANAHMLLFDPRTATLAKGALQLPMRSTKRIVPLAGGNIVFVSHEGGVHVMKRIEA